jgi:ferredoxin-NADP reductase
MRPLFRSLFAARSSPLPGELELVVTELRQEADDVRSFRLEAASGARLPAFSPGSHVDVHLDIGLVRQYSISSDPADLGHYRIAVLREERSRGGSVHVHTSWRQGMTVRTSLPRNNFPLAEAGGRFHLIAGGIGIAPLLPMALELRRRGDPFSLYYCARAPERAAFAEHVKNIAGEAAVSFHYSRAPVPNRLDVAGLIASIPETDHVYCCGPARLIGAVQAASRDRPRDRLRFEHFAPPEQLNGETEPFEVVLARTGETCIVPAGESLLEALHARGHAIDSSCREGICGTCRVSHVDGEVLHRDHVLSAAERRTTMAACVSRARGCVVLDL